MNDMENKHPVVDYFEHRAQRKMEDSVSEFMQSAFKKEEHKKKTILFRSGDSNTKHYFVAKGLIRLYVIDPNGKEFNVLFAKENQMLGDLATPARTQFFLETIEKSVLYTMDNRYLAEFNHSLTKALRTTGAELLKSSYIFLQKRLVSILTKTAEENYMELQKNFPGLVQRLPQYHIASYLGVSPEFLSKIIAKSIKNT